jgi:hypothetical protein
MLLFFLPPFEAKEIKEMIDRETCFTDYFTDYAL